MGADALTDGYLSSATMAEALGSRATLARMLEFEAALARVQAALGVIPAAAATAIEAACVPEGFDLETLRRGTAEASNPAVPLARLLTERVAASDAEASRWVHWGATSQDVVDTAFVLQLRDASRRLAALAASNAEALAALVQAERATPMVARTLSQHAAPTTFGLKAALWLDGLVTGRAQLQAAAAGLPLQFAGAAGTLAALGGDGLAVRDALAEALDLPVAPPWHTNRAVVRRFAAAAAELGAAAGKIAHDVVALAASDVGELREAGEPGRGGSSSLPHKRNPVAAIAVVAGARRLPGCLSTLYAAFDLEHERAAGAWHVEAPALRELLVTLAAMLEQLERVLGGLEVDRDTMRRNLDANGGIVMAEAVSMALAKPLGRSRAQALVREAVARVRAGEGTFREVLAADAEVRSHLAGAALDTALDPLACRGAADAFIDEILERFDHGRS